MTFRKISVSRGGVPFGDLRDSSCFFFDDFVMGTFDFQLSKSADITTAVKIVRLPAVARKDVRSEWRKTIFFSLSE